MNISTDYNKNVNYLSMPTSGVVSTKYDGYEDIYTLDKLENLTAKALVSLLMFYIGN